MIQVSYKIDHAPAIFSQIRQQLNYTLEDRVFIHKSPFVHSCIRPIQFNESTSCMISKFRLNEPARVERLRNNKDLLVFDFHFSESAPLFIPGKKGPSHLIFGVFLSTDAVHSYADFSNKDTYRQIAIFVDRKEVLKILGENNTRLQKLLEHQEAFHLFREISHKLAKEVEELQECALQSNTNEPLLHGMTLKIISLCLAEFEVEKLPVKLSLANDLKEIMLAGNFIEKHINDHLALEDLVALTSMSSSKFRKEFKAVYGTSPMQYVKQKKLWRAKHLIESGETISQAAYSVGYTNLSYFTRSFKSQFHLNPKDYREFISTNTLATKEKQ